jgi:hypothetical protein
MKDFLGEDLKVGDSVILVIPRYRGYVVGVIERFTKSYVFVSFPKPWPGACVGGGPPIKQNPSQLIKLTEEQVREYQERVGG